MEILIVCFKCSVAGCLREMSDQRNGGNVAIHKLPRIVGHRGMMPEHLKKGLVRLDPGVA